MTRPVLSNSERDALKAVAAAGAIAFLSGLVLAPARAWGALLWANFFFLSAAAGALVFVAMHHAAGAGWPTVFRRVPEAMSAYLAAGGALAVLGVLGAPTLYHWAHPDDAVLQAKAAWLNLPAFGVRTAIYAAAWVLLGRRILAVSRQQDSDGSAALVARGRRASVAFLVVFALTFSLASVDWLMSLEPHWYSTLYPWYVGTGAIVSGLAGTAALAILLRRRGVLPELGAGHLHDLGKLLFGFSCFWGYLWFSQYLLIWYSNIPEETGYFVSRLEGRWLWLFVANPVVNLVVPFVFLLPASAKRSESRMLWACGLVLAGRALDLYLLIAPGAHDTHLRPGAVELGLFAGLGAAFLLAFDGAFSRAAPVPRKDPYLVESLALR